MLVLLQKEFLAKISKKKVHIKIYVIHILLLLKKNLLIVSKQERILKVLLEIKLYLIVLLIVENKKEFMFSGYKFIMKVHLFVKELFMQVINLI
jgi:hypothetical protein